MNNKLIWNTYKYNSDTCKLDSVNIFEFGTVQKDIIAILKTNLQENEKKEQIKRALFYWFGFNSDFEFFVVDDRISVYQQILMNYDAFYEYLKRSINGEK